MIDFLKELTRRKVWLFGGIYLALGWVLLQVAIAIESTMKLPDWIDQSVLVLLVIGFPITLLLAWAQESTGGAKELPDAMDDSDRRPTMSVAVLPFTNMSDEKELGWIGDGIAEDLTTLLSIHDMMRVSARNSAFAWKGQSPDVREVGERLGVRYVVEGSLRQTGDIIRVIAQLIDANSGDHVWAESYDHATLSLAGMQDNIVRAIATQTVSALKSCECSRVRQASAESLRPPEVCLLANDISNSPMTLQGLVRASEILEKANQESPEAYEILATMGEIYAWRSAFDFKRRKEFAAKADEALSAVLRRKATSPRVLEAACEVMSLSERHEEHLHYALKLDDQAVIFGGVHRASAFLSHGRFDEAVQDLEEWLALADERDNRRGFVQETLGKCYFGKRQFEKAEELAREVLLSRQSTEVFWLLLMALGQQGKTDEAGPPIENLQRHDRRPRPEGDCQLQSALLCRQGLCRIDDRGPAPRRVGRGDIRCLIF